MSHLTNAQLLTLKNSILTETDSTFVTYRQANDKFSMASWYNVSSTTVTWKSLVSITDTGKAFNGNEWAGMTSANHSRLQTVAQYMATYNPGLADIRAMFNDIWSGAGGALTRASLLALWKRFATRGEKLYATGTGTDASPAILVFEGLILSSDINDALEAV